MILTQILNDQYNNFLDLLVSSFLDLLLLQRDFHLAQGWVIPLFLQVSAVLLKDLLYLAPLSFRVTFGSFIN